MAESDKPHSENLYDESIRNSSEDSVSGESRERFVSSVCLIVAAKAIELDKRVPYLNRYQRYA